MVHFRALLIDDQQSNLNNVAESLRGTLREDVHFVFLMPATESANIVGNSFVTQLLARLYSEIWIVGSDGAIQILGSAHPEWRLEKDERDIVFFLPYVMQDPANVLSGGAWNLLTTLASALLEDLDTIVVDCNLDARPHGTLEFFTHGTILLNKLVEIGLEKDTLIVLNTAQPNITPASVAAVREPKKAVKDKTYGEVIAILRDRYDGFVAGAAGMKPSGLAMRYAELHNSRSGAEVGHGLSESLRTDWVVLLKNTREHLRRLSVGLDRAAFQDPILLREAQRVAGFQAALAGLDEITLQDAEGSNAKDLLDRWFNPAFTNTVPFQTSASEHDGPLAKSVDRTIFSFGSWRRRLCKVYLNNPVERLAWAYWLKEWVQRSGSDSVVVEFEPADKTEVFLPQEWLLDLFAYLCDRERFLRHFLTTAEVSGPVQVSIRTNQWNSPYRDKVFKAALLVSYDKVRLPDLISGVECRGLSKLTVGSFAVESQRYFYDLYLVSRADDDTTDVYEFRIDDQNDRLIPSLCEAGTVPIFPRRGQHEGHSVHGTSFLKPGHTCGLVFVFESAMEKVIE